MPGIAGIIGKGCNLEHRDQLESMLRCLRHESFYNVGTFVSEEAGFALGWVSHAGSFADCMPIWSEDKKVCLIFAGEEYQDRSVIDKLRADGHEFDKHGAGYLVHLYESVGLRFLERLNGWFSGVIIDSRTKNVFLFNDRYGIGRICYYEQNGKLYFSSEAKSLLKILPNLRSLDFRSLAEVFSCGSVLQNRTLFAGVSLLPPGSIWSFTNSVPTKKATYFDARSWEGLPMLDEREYYAQFKETWKRVLPRYFPEGENIGLSLTGGVDSRMILAWAPRSPGALPCYTFSGRYRDCNDVKLARNLAKLCDQPYRTIPIDDVFLSQFPSLAQQVAYIGEGNLDISGTTDLFVQKEARKVAPIRVTGTNGGELLRRLVMFKPAPFAEEMLDPAFSSSVREAESTYIAELNCHRLSFTAFKQTPWYMNSKFVVERSQIQMRLPFCDNDLVRLSYQAPTSMAQANGPALRLIADGNPALGRIGTDRALTTRSVPGIGKARHFVQEFTFKAEYAYDVGMPPWLARFDHAVAPLRLEKLFLGRHKFHHFRVYYRDELRRYVEEVLLDPRTLGRPFLNAHGVEAAVRGHVGGYRNYTSEIHRLLCLELMQRQLVEQN